MDNGLIFPYRQSNAHDESSDANHPKLCLTSHFLREVVGGVVERGIRTG